MNMLCIIPLQLLQLQLKKHKEREGVFIIFAAMKRHLHIVILLFGLAMLTGCDRQQREARRMVARAEALSDTNPDSTARLIDSVLRMPVYFGERQRMEMALLQGEALFRNAPLDDDGFEDTAYRVATSPELERAADYYAKKKQYTKAAHAALYSGYVQQHYNENENAMHSYKATRSIQNEKALRELGITNKQQINRIFDRAITEGNIIKTQTTNYGTVITRQVEIGKSGCIDVGFFYENSNMLSIPKVITIIPKIY